MAHHDGEPKYHSSKHVAREEPHELTETELAQRGLKKYREFDKQAKSEVQEAFAPLRSLSVEQLGHPQNIKKLESTLNRFTERLKPHSQAFKVIYNGLTDRAMRDTGQMLIEFHDKIEEYKKNIEHYESTLPKVIAALQHKKQTGGLRGADLIRINTQIAQLQEIVPKLKLELQQAENARDEQVSTFSSNAMNSAIFRIKLANILTELGDAMKEKTTQAMQILVCVSELLFSDHQEPYTLKIDRQNGTFELQEREPEQEFSFWSQTGKIRAAQNRLKIQERLYGKREKLQPGDLIE